MTKTKIVGKMGIIQLAGVILLLVILPLGSWYYLQTGLDYRLEAMKELKDYGKIPELAFSDLRDSTVQQNRFANGLMVGHFFSEEGKETYGKLVAKFQDQFEERKDVFLVAFENESSPEAREKLGDFAAAYGLEDKPQCYFLTGERPEMERVARAISFPADPDNNHLLFFADSLMVRAYYDMRQEEDIRRLVKHITLNLMPEEDAGLIFEREVEK